MKKIKDRVLLGVISGMAASEIVKALIDIQYRFGWTDLKLTQLGASIFLPEAEAKAYTRGSKIIATIVNDIMVSLNGVIITYMLSITGRDYAALKGAGVALTQWIGVWGIFSKIGLIMRSNKPLTHIVSSFDHALFGALAGFFVSRLGEDSLFPDREVKKGEKFTLVCPPWHAGISGEGKIPEKNKKVLLIFIDRAGKRIIPC